MLSEKMMTIENVFKVTQWSPDEFERRHPGVDPSLVSSCRSNFLAKGLESSIKGIDGANNAGFYDATLH